MSESKEVQSLIERVVGEISERRVAELRKDVVKRITRETEDIVDAVFSEVADSHLPELRKDVISSVLKETQDGIEGAVSEAIDQRTKELRKEIVGRISEESKIVTHGVIAEALDSSVDEIKQEVVGKVAAEAQASVERALSSTLDKRLAEMRGEIIEKLAQEARKMFEGMVPHIMDAQIGQLRADLSSRMTQETQATVEKIVPQVLDSSMNAVRDGIIAKVNQKTHKTIDNLVPELLDKGIGEMRADTIARMTKSTKNTIEATIPNIVEKRLGQLRKDVTDGVMTKTRETVDKVLPEVFADRFDELKKDCAVKIWKELEPMMGKGKGKEKDREEEPHAAAGNSSGMLDAAVASIQEASSQSEILRNLLEGASNFSGRVALFIVKGNNLAGWQGRGFKDNEKVKNFSLSASDGLSGRAINDRTTVAASASEFDGGFISAVGSPAQGNANVLPLLVKDKVPAVMYADSGTDKQGKSDASALQLLVRTAGLWLEVLAMRKAGVVTTASSPEAAAQAVESASMLTPTPLPGSIRVPEAAMAAAATAPAPAASSGPATIAPGDEEVHKKAKRFAKLLVDEIKLYNQGKVNEGRQNRDLYDRLKEDIEKSKATYDKRYGSTPASSANYFNDEIVRVLADNDAALMGGNFSR
jgi:hypothetical protein